MKKLLTILPLLVLLGCEKKSDSRTDCIDQSAINPDMLCIAVYDPVCGCDGVTYSNACVAASQGVRQSRPGACECEYPYHGTVVDYTGLDGCSQVILLSDSTVLEPVKLPKGASLQTGSMVMLNYTEMNSYASACMLGVLADITCLKQSSCIAITQPNLAAPPMSDEVFIKTAVIKDDCLTINFSYGGGCEPHEFELRELPIFCGTPPAPPVTLQFMHNANGDACEALLSRTLSYDLSSLREPGLNSIPIAVIDYHGNFAKTLSYNY